MNIVKFFLFVADIVFKPMCITSVSAVNMELNFGSDADFVRFLVVAAAPTPISLLSPSVLCIYAIPLYSFIVDDFFKSLLVSHSWCLFSREIS